MDDFEIDVERLDDQRELLAWELAPDSDGALVLGLKYATRSEQNGSADREVRVLLPPEAALYLSRELARQAKEILAASDFTPRPN